MKPAKTHGAALPQKELTRLVGGCHLGPRPSDIVLEGHEGANPHVGQRVADIGTLHCPGVPVNMLGDQLCNDDRPVMHHTRKLDHKTAILDLFHRALESSDSINIDMSLGIRKKKMKHLTKSFLF